MGQRQRGQIIKNGDGSFSVRYYLGGKRRRDGTFKTETAAKRHLREVLSAMDSGLRGDLSLSALLARWLDVYDAAPGTRARVTRQARIVENSLGGTDVRKITPEMVATFRMGVSEGQRHQIHGLLRQVLDAAVRWGYATTNPAKSVPNPTPKRREVAIFHRWSDIDAVAEEIGPEYGPLVILAAGTGLRPSEWAALRVEDIDLSARVLTVQRSYTVAGGLVSYVKTAGSRRRVPLRARVVSSLRDAMPPRGLVFEAPRGGHVNLQDWRSRYWQPAVEAAGLPPLRPYAMRHTYAAMSLAAGINTFAVARRMGTSVEMIHATYGHLVHDADDTEIATLDAWDSGL